jgi:hypothetical protein
MHILSPPWMDGKGPFFLLFAINPHLMTFPPFFPDLWKFFFSSFSPVLLLLLFHPFQREKEKKKSYISNNTKFFNMAARDLSSHVNSIDLHSYSGHGNRLSSSIIFHQRLFKLSKKKIYRLEENIHVY